MTLGIHTAHGGPDQSLEQWLASEQLLDAAEFLRVLFARTDYLFIDDVATLLSYSESKQIVQTFSDNQLLRRVSELCSRFYDNPIRDRYRSARSSGKLGAGSDDPLWRLMLSDVNRDRNRLRFVIWLLVQAIVRMEDKQISRDQNIYDLARSLVATSKNSHFKRLDNILVLLNQVNEAAWDADFELYTEKLLFAANKLKTPSDRRNSLLVRVLHIAHGDVTPFKDKHQDPAVLSPSIRLSLLPDVSGNRRRTQDFLNGYAPANDDSSEGADDINSVLEIYPAVVDFIDEDDEDPTQLINLPIQSEPQNRLSLRSYRMQRAIQSHYLPWDRIRILPIELEPLKHWIFSTKKDESIETRVGACVSELALNTGRSLVYVLDFAISDTSCDSWSVSQDCSRVHRLVPKRHGAWSPTDTQKPLVHPSSDLWSIKLDACTQAILQRAIELTEQKLTSLSLYEEWSEAPRLAHVWAVLHTETVEVWFNTVAKQMFPRLTSAKLGKYLEYKVFERTQDQDLACLVASDSRSALPASVSYRCWSVSDVDRAVQSETEPQLDQILLGSRLSVYDEFVNGILRRGLQIWNSADQGKLVEQHNFLAQYTVCALQFALGTRYLKDPFETLAHFSVSQGLAYVSDKSDDNLHQARLVPLPAKAAEMLTVYCEHLKRFASAVSSIHPDLSESITMLVSAKPAQLPLFFLLDPSLRWHHMSEVDAVSVQYFEFDLPKNLPRHWYAQRLHAEGVDCEVINAWMGHSERGAETYGDLSSRCFMTDIKAYRSAIDHIFNGLHFPPIRLPKLTADRLPNVGLSPLRDARFGWAERRLKRVKSRRNALRQVREHITTFLDGRSFDDLSESEIKQLQKEMLLRADGFAQSYAGLRHDCLVKRLKRDDSKHLRSITQRALGSETASTLLKPAVLQALDFEQEIPGLLTRLKRAFDPSNHRARGCRLIAIIMLMLEKRLVYRQLIHDLRQGKNFRIVHMLDHFALEYSELLRDDDWEQPVQRHRISFDTARVISLSIESKQAFDLDSPVPKILTDIQQKVEKVIEKPCTQVGQLITALSLLIEQSNLVLFPGPVAAALSGRILPTSLTLSSYLRVATRRIHTPPVSTEVVDNVPEELEQAALAGVALSVSVPEREEAAKVLCKQVYQSLSADRRVAGPSVAKEIRSLCDQAESVSPAVKLLCHWIAHLCEKGKGPRHQNHKPYAASTLREYLSRLRVLFTDFAYDLDLRVMDSDELTELYAQFEAHLEHYAFDKSYPLKRLYEFHQWAVSIGVEPVHWFELSLKDDRRHVSPEIISIADYKYACERVNKLTDLSANHRLYMRVLLTLGRCFGFRRQEALGLRVSDLMLYQSEIAAILAEPHSNRRLKSDNSRRANPRVLVSLENDLEILKSLALRLETLGKEYPEKLLHSFFEMSSDSGRVAERLMSRLGLVLKEATGRWQTRFHHLRHTCENSLSVLLLNPNTPLANKIIDTAQRDTVAQTLLGTQDVNTRRATAAVSMFMGHQSIMMDLKNYDHLVTDWIDDLLPVKSSRRTLNHVEYTREWAKRTRESFQGQHAPDLEDDLPTLELLLIAAKFIGNGAKLEHISRRTGVRLHLIVELSDLLADISTRMLFKESYSGGRWVRKPTDPYVLLQRVKPTAWDSMIKAAADVKEAQCPGLEELLAYEVRGLFNAKRLLHCSQPHHYRLVSYTFELFRIPIGAARTSEVKPEGSRTDFSPLVDLIRSPLVSVEELGSDSRYPPFQTYSQGRDVKQTDYLVFQVDSDQSAAAPDSYSRSVALIVTALWQIEKYRHVSVSSTETR